MKMHQLKCKLNVPREVRFLWFYTFLCNLGSISSGTVMGYSAVTLPALTRNTSSITLDTTEVSLFVSLAFICQGIGSLLSLITMKYGRRFSMVVAGVTNFLGYILIASSYTIEQLFAGRILTAITITLYAVPTTAYLEEISMISWKGFITMTRNVGTAAGILLVYFIGFLMQDNWKMTAALCSIPAILFVLCNIFFIPESPGWLLLKNRKEEAKIALLRIRGLRKETIDFQEEFTMLVNYIELKSFRRSSRLNSLTEEIGKRPFSFAYISSKLKNIKKTIRLPEVWKPFVILNLFFFFQQFSGLYVVIYYAIDITVNFHITMDPFLVTVLIGILELVAIVITTCCSNRIGRRTISIVSGAGMSISVVILAVYIQFFEDTDITAIPFVCLIIYMTFGSLGFLPLPWSMVGELCPTKYVSVLGPLVTFIGSLFGSAVMYLYPAMVTQGMNIALFFSCIVCIIATFFIIFALPETRGRTKTQIEDAFRGKSQIEN